MLFTYLSRSCTNNSADKTVNDYYRDASSCSYAKDVRVPMLALNALDDPIACRTSIPYDECKVHTVPAGYNNLLHTPLRR
jgi:predicted alpha/beta-fold hydrolase